MRKLTFIPLLLALIPALLRGQNVSDLVISEILAQPDSTGIMDAYGDRTGWIEVFNNSQGTVNIGGCYLTNDRNVLTKSIIPKGYTASQLLPRQQLLFFTNGRGGHQGLQNTNFTLTPGQTVYLVSNDGRTIIDSLAIPASLPVGQSVYKMAEDAKGMDFKVKAEPNAIPTPGALNSDPSSKSKSQILKETDPHGFTLSLVSILVVLFALALLWGIFTLIFGGTQKKTRTSGVPRNKHKGGCNPLDETAAAIALALNEELSGGPTYAAIAMALHLYLTEYTHDLESYVITIRPSSSLSGWGTKGQNFRKIARK